ncbi:hypothetical protein C1752_09743 [Acaryochloris thomasi RCC1774]|uniref:GAF domain-containing protein n=1 Tax=Acaryochloris thomasi RCC1774 TaxID=1764569 RepID=A0A2W1JKK0_9CYAN|nr:GAF domain-containing protein [Acaryochloris thomasi]PZD70734.1 hypothetical protein C1752_09743 [Acaryochloris thomasi RCC1774]
MKYRQLSWSRRETLGLLRGVVGSLTIGSCARTKLIAQPPSRQGSFHPQTTSSAMPEAASPDLPQSLTAALQNSRDPNSVLTALMPVVVKELRCDRCFLFVRAPLQRLTRITHGYSRETRWPTMVQSTWSPESQALNQKDPLTASAYRSSQAHFIGDIESAPTGTLDLALERSVFRHRALIHAPIYQGNVFYGILEPCVFETPRIWTRRDRKITTELQERLGPWIVRYLQ